MLLDARVLFGAEVYYPCAPQMAVWLCVACIILRAKKSQRLSFTLYTNLYEHISAVTAIVLGTIVASWNSFVRMSCTSSDTDCAWYLFAADI